MVSGPGATRRWQRWPTTHLFLIFLTVIFILWFMMGSGSPWGTPALTETWLKYSTVSGFFLQDDPETDPEDFDFTKTNFGLIDQPYDTDSSLDAEFSNPTQWQRFSHKLSVMNKEAVPETSYKLLFLGRHGEGYHNVAERFYGTKAWDCYFSLLPGNGTSTWADAHLTPLGESQALAAHHFWQQQLTTQFVPVPELYVSSPMDRAIHTAHLTFSNLDLPPNKQFRANALIKEGLRECIGIHTCDRRSTKAEIAKRWPPPPEGDFTFESHFSEKDALWLPDLRESASAQTARLRGLLDDLFEHEASDRDLQVLSLTSHSGTIAATLRAVKHRPFQLLTGGVIPVLVRIERMVGTRPKEVVEPWKGLPKECDEEQAAAGVRL